LTKLIKNIDDNLVHAVPKRRPGETDEEYAKMSRDRCREIIREAEEQHLKPRNEKSSNDE
jgi:hypothetical protein